MINEGKMTMGKTLAEMTAEIREVNTEKGWRTGDNTFGDYVALLHSEISEALEAYRDHRLADATEPGDAAYSVPPKPEGVGSELADVLIRLLDMADVCGLPLIEADLELDDVTGFKTPISGLETFGDHMAWLHLHAGYLWQGGNMPRAIRALVTVVEKYGIDLTAEYERKMAYARTRPYQHGGRTLHDSEVLGTHEATGALILSVD